MPYEYHQVQLKKYFLALNAILETSLHMYNQVNKLGKKQQQKESRGMEIIQSIIKWKTKLKSKTDSYIRLKTDTSLARTDQEKIEEKTQQ